MLLHPGEIMVLAQQDEGEAFVVPQQHVVGRAEALDQLGFEQEGLGLGAGGDDGQRAGLRHHPLQALGQLGDLGVTGHPVLQRPRLADVEDVAARILHPIDARPPRQGRQNVADRRHAGIEIGRAGAANRVGRGFLVEALCGAWMVGSVGLAHRADLGPTPP